MTSWLVLLDLLVSSVSLAFQGSALTHLARLKATRRAEHLAGHGYVRTVACRVAVAVMYFSVAALQAAGVHIGTLGVLSPEALLVLAMVQAVWLVNTALDMRLRHQLGKPASDCEPPVRHRRRVNTGGTSDA